MRAQLWNADLLRAVGQDLRLVLLMPFRRFQRRAIRRTYVVCATPRSGSTLLCEHLIRSGRAGFPTEWLLPGFDTFRGWFGGLPPVDQPGYLETVQRRTTTVNGVFGMKAMWPEMEGLVARLSRGVPQPPDPMRLLEGVLPSLELVHISRRDQLRQAVSHLVAIETDRWHVVRHFPGAPVSRKASAPARSLATVEDRKALVDSVLSLRDETRRQEQCWERFFTACRVTPHRVVFEDLVADPEGVTRRLLEQLGADGPRSTWNTYRSHQPTNDERSREYLRIVQEACGVS